MAFCFYNNKKVADGAVEHMGDNLTGAGSGHDETVKVELSKVPSDVERIVFAVTIDELIMRKEYFWSSEQCFYPYCQSRRWR